MSTRHRISGASSRHTVFPWLLWPKSVRAKTVALLAVPVVSLMALWALATVSAVQNAWTLHQVKEVNGTLSAPLRSLVNDLQAERAAVAGQLAAQRADGDSAVSIQRGRTAAAATALLDGVVVARADIENLAPEVNWRIDALMQDLDGLRGNAPSIFARQMDWRAAYGAYTAAIEDAFAVDEALAKVQHSQAASAARVVLQLGRVGEMISRQDAIATSALAAGRMTQGQQQAFGDALGGQHVLTSSLLPELPPADQAAYQRLVNDASYRSLATMQDDLLSVGVVNGAVTSFSADQWHGAVRLLMQGVPR